MAKYTMELKRVCELYSREEVESWFKDYCLFDYLTQSEVKQIEETGVWNKDRLAKMIVNHYYVREIGFETPALFRHYAKVTMDEIMESKLPLIYTNSIKYDLLTNVDYTETYTRNIEQSSSGEGTSNSSSSNSGSSLNVSSDTPQGQISKSAILSGSYASNTTANETESSINDESSTTSSSEGNTIETFTKNTKGNQGISSSYQAMIKQYRENIVSINKDIIEELDKLFFGLY